MLWAALVAGGVAIVSMAIFGARLTRKPDEDPPEDIAPNADPNDPWAAWRPRPFEELDRPPRPRMWPVLASLTGLILVGGGLAGARQTFQQTEAIAGDSTPEPFELEVKVTPSPTPVPTPTPKPTVRPVQATAKPAAAAQAAAPAAAGPVISGSASCSEGKARVNFLVTSRGDATLTYIGVYLDGKVVGGGPVNSTRYQAQVERSTTPGDHDLEVSAQDKAGKSSRKQWRAHCA
jgi:hypothetical protein